MAMVALPTMARSLDTRGDSIYCQNSGLEVNEDDCMHAAMVLITKRTHASQ